MDAVGNNNSDIGDRLRALRVELGLRGNEVTQRSRGAIPGYELSKYEHGKTSVKKWEALAEAYGLSVEVLEQVATGELKPEDAAKLSTVHLLPRPTRPHVLQRAPRQKARIPAAKSMAELRQLPLAELAKELHKQPPAPPLPIAQDAAPSVLENLEATIKYHASNGRFWRGDVIGAARGGHFGDSDFSAKEWEKLLDELEEDLAKLARRRGKH